MSYSDFLPTMTSGLPITKQVDSTSIATLETVTISDRATEIAPALTTATQTVDQVVQRSAPLLCIDHVMKKVAPLTYACTKCHQELTMPDIKITIVTKSCGTEVLDENSSPVAIGVFSNAIWGNYNVCEHFGYLRVNLNVAGCDPKIAKSLMLLDTEPFYHMIRGYTLCKIGKTAASKTTAEYTLQGPMQNNDAVLNSIFYILIGILALLVALAIILVTK